MLQFFGVTKNYGRNTAVDNFSLTVAQGELLGVLGPNGAGKSTAISMLATLIKPTKGSIQFRGVDIANNPDAIRKILGYVPQEIALYETLTGIDNLLFWGKAHGLKGKLLKSRIDWVSELIALDDQLSLPVSTYSGGMKRRLNFGVALLHNPQLLILDEPTVGIDPQSRKHLLESIKELNRNGMTIIYTSHYMEEVSSLCNQIAIMDRGKLIASGTQGELLNLGDDENTQNSLEGVFFQLTGNALRG